MKRETTMSIIWTALGTAALGVIGWLCLSVIHLQNQYAAESAEKKLRQDVTDVMNDVDKRLAVIEALMTRSAAAEPVPPAPVPVPYDPFVPDLLQQAPEPPMAPMEEPEEEPQQQRQFAPRYDLRKQQTDN